MIFLGIDGVLRPGINSQTNNFINQLKLMASFKTHITTGIITSGLAATSGLIAGIISPGEAFIYFGLGTLGSILPDLDADNSIPTRVGMGMLSIGLAFTIVFALAKVIPSLFQLIGIWIVSFLFLRYIVFILITRITIHRGLFHSIPAGLILGLLTTVTASRFLQQTSLRAWLAGIFIASGYFVHLLLDEFYSIDWAGRRIKRSFGSAFKLWSTANWIGTIVLYLCCIGLYYISPNPRSFLNAATYFTKQIYSQQQPILNVINWWRPLNRN